MLMLMVILTLKTISIVNSNGIGKCGVHLCFRRLAERGRRELGLIVPGDM